MVVRTVRALFLLLVVSLVTASPSSAQSSVPCDPSTDVVVTIDYGDLDGETAALCVSDADGRSAADVLADTGVTVESSAGAPPMVCRIDGQPAPAAESCGASLSGEGYWAFYVATVDGPWGYAQVGPGEHTVAAGDLVSFVYTPLSDSSPELPAFPTDAATFAEATDVSGLDAGDTFENTDDEDGQEADDDSSVTWQLGAGALVVVLVAAAAVLMGRRRRD